MAMNKRQRSDIDGIIEELIEAGNGRYDERDARESIAAYIRAEADAGRMDGWIETEAAAQHDRYAKAHRWEPSAEQSNMFDPEAILSLGEGVSVRMKNATEIDLALYDEIQANNYQHVSEMYFRKNRAIRIWRAQLRGTDKTLGEVA